MLNCICRICGCEMRIAEATVCLFHSVKRSQLPAHTTKHKTQKLFFLCSVFCTSHRHSYFILDLCRPSYNTWGIALPLVHSVVPQFRFMVCLRAALESCKSTNRSWAAWSEAPVVSSCQSVINQSSVQKGPTPEVDTAAEEESCIERARDR